MSKISTLLSISLIIISFIIGIGFGYYFTPQYSLSMYEKDDMDLGPADKWVDLRYINAMISHHQGAIILAKQAKQSQRPEIQTLVEDILTNEPILIEELYKWKKDWYGDIKKIANPKVSNLGDYNNSFDLRFLNAIITHHENGIYMTKEIKRKSNRNEILDNADAVEKFLIESGQTLKEWRESWYNI